MKEEYLNRQKLKKLFDALFDYAKTSPKAMKETSDIIYSIIKESVKNKKGGKL